MNYHAAIADALADGRHLCLAVNGPLVRVTQLTVAPFDEEEDIETLVGDFDRGSLIRALVSLEPRPTPTAPTLIQTRTDAPAPAKRGGIGVSRWWRRGRR